MSYFIPCRVRKKCRRDYSSSDADISLLLLFLPLDLILRSLNKYSSINLLLKGKFLTLQSASALKSCSEDMYCKDYCKKKKKDMHSEVFFFFEVRHIHSNIHRAVYVRE